MLAAKNHRHYAGGFSLSIKPRRVAPAGAIQMKSIFPSHQTKSEVQFLSSEKYFLEMHFIFRVSLILSPLFIKEHRSDTHAPAHLIPLPSMYRVVILQPSPTRMETVPHGHLTFMSPTSWIMVSKTVKNNIPNRFKAFYHQ